jgi:hypothetical protein
LVLLNSNRIVENVFKSFLKISIDFLVAIYSQKNLKAFVDNTASMKAAVKEKVPDLRVTIWRT